MLVCVWLKDCRSLPIGSYHVEVASVQHEFQQVRLEIGSKNEPVRAFYVSTEDSSVPSQRAPYPLVLKPVGQIDYFTEKPAFDPFSLLKNPMVIMMLVFGVMMFAMPSVNAAVQEQQKELQKQQELNVRKQQ